jgi:hypothetical protein
MKKGIMFLTTTNKPCRMNESNGASEQAGNLSKGCTCVKGVLVAVKCTSTQAGKQTGRHADKQTSRQADKQPSGQADK